MRGSESQPEGGGCHFEFLDAWSVGSEAEEEVRLCITLFCETWCAMRGRCLPVGD